MEPASPQTGATLTLFWIVGIVAAVIFAFVAGWIVWNIVKYRAKPGDPEPPQEYGNVKLELTWTAVPILIIVFLFFASLVTMLKIDPLQSTSPQPDVVVTAHQWWWDVRYPNLRVRTANEIHVPVGRRLYFQIDSADVIHDFWVPQLTRKIDAIPGHPNYVWMNVDTPGVYRGTCAEFCGAQHAHMRIRVVAQTEEDFEAWAKQQAEVAPKPTTELAKKGLEHFSAMACPSCHAILGVPGAGGAIGPDLTHLASRATLASGTILNTPENLRRWLAEPDAIKPGSHMPNFHLDAHQLDALTAYLETLQ